MESSIEALSRVSFLISEKSIFHKTTINNDHENDHNHTNNRRTVVFFWIVLKFHACLGEGNYYRGLNNYQYHFEVHLRYHRPQLYKEHGTMILVII